MKETFELMKEKIMKDRRIGRSSLEAFLEILNEVECKCSESSKRSWYAKGYLDAKAEYGNGWIPVDSGRMPKANDRILCLHEDGFIECGELIGKAWCCDMDEYAIKRDDIIAWMPLPETYKPGEGE